MDDLLASIRRAIHDEGLDILESDDVSAMEDDESEKGKSEKAIAPTSRPAVEQPQEDNSNEIISLRNKIARELNKDLGAPHLSVVPAPRTEPGSPSPRIAPGFKSLLGGEKTPRAILPDTHQPKPVSRAAAVPSAPRRTQPVHSVRPSQEGPSKSGTSFRPPFGQTSTGLRSLQLPMGNDGMISPETSDMTAHSFTRLAEQVFGREEGARSIDDLARELLHPMLKKWLDENLPRLVERLVREEIERVARRGRR
jgi:cell pole-organizing protein PopZ